MEQIQGNPTPPATTHYPTSITQECTTQTMTMTMMMTMMMMGITLECTTQTTMMTIMMMAMKDERDEVQHWWLRTLFRKNMLGFVCDK